MDIDKRVGLTLKLDHKDDTKSPELIAANVTSQSHESIEKEMAEFKLVELNENLDANVRVNLKLDRDRRWSIQVGIAPCCATAPVAPWQAPVTTLPGRPGNSQVTVLCTVYCRYCGDSQKIFSR